MDSNRIKNLALGVRASLMAEISGRLDAVLAAGSPERLERPGDVSALEAALKEQGRNSLVESAAYTWFNRLCALRFMDANGYTAAPVVTPRPGSTQPAILADASSGVFDPEYEISEETRRRVLGLLAGTIPSENAAEAAYSELLIAICRHYAKPMPYLFADSVASPLLMPQGLLAEGSILSRIVEGLDDEECESVEVLGWLYQFYVSERKDEYFKGLKKGKKASREDIAAATQLFTPEWIVRYLSENSLGRLWVLNNPGSDLASQMDYYIAPEEGVEEPHIEVSSAEEIRVLDPACGSGHILVYCFDLLFRMYEEEGWLPEDIPQKILENNLFGLEIDPRAAEIASFALEMKARDRDSRFFEKNIDVHITVLKPVELSAEQLALVPKVAERHALLDAMSHLDEVGSLYVPDALDVKALRDVIDDLSGAADLVASTARERCEEMLANVEVLSGSYHCVVANPPYMKSGDMNQYLASWISENATIGKYDLCAAFIVRGGKFVICNGYLSMITMQSWMTIKSARELRMRIIYEFYIRNLVLLGPHAFDTISGEVVSTVAFTLISRRAFLNERGCYQDLYDGRTELEKIKLFRNSLPGNYICQNAFTKVPGLPIIVDMTDELSSDFARGVSLGKIAYSKPGMQTSDNDRFLRIWAEVSYRKIGFGMSSMQAKQSGAKWFPYNKGDGYRKWYGNCFRVLNYENDGQELKYWLTHNPKDPTTTSWSRNMRNYSYYFHEGITYTAIGSSYSARLNGPGFLFDTKGPTIFSDDNLYFICAFVNTSIFSKFNKMLTRQLTKSSSSINDVPLINPNEDEKKEIESKAMNNVSIARCDWDSFETSWDFSSHPLCQSGEPLIERQYSCWERNCRERFDELKSNEEELNRIFARIYNMEGEVPIEVPEDKVCVRLADLGRDVRSLVSYGVGCLLGRYSTEKEGLVLADQDSTLDDFKDKVPGASFLPDEDGVLPILDADWFGDDIVSGFKEWLSSTYGADTLDENVRFIEGAVGKDLRSYFLKDFYPDHIKTYQKRPIYWLFQSPKKGFSALIYMHRYTPSTVGTVLSEYLRPYMDKLRQRCIALDIPGATASELNEMDKLYVTIEELEKWEREIVYPLAQRRVEIDLDDGVKVNYNKFPHALAKVPGLSDWK